MLSDYFKIKGTKEGLVIIAEDCTDIDSLKEKIVNRIEHSLTFFKGAQLTVKVKSLDISQAQIDELLQYIMDKYGISVKIKKIQERRLKNVNRENTVFEGLEEGMTKFHSGTVRSGQIIKYYGNLVVLGDVNPGGIVQASGNIVIVGALRGIAHAGFSGNDKAVIAATKINAMQLRINNVISRSPDNVSNTNYPEIALIKKNKIVVKPLY
ncbi:MAG: septum site-determining protein MinC [Thermoanaerobacteraceae bacterium]|jgi:septum site-determining protein MinC|nr:septum site-determining protein MinC [Thermoanaerobacteraceae bacterium]